MNWLQKYCSYGVTVYHASPDRHFSLKPRSSIGKGSYSLRGLYFTENFRSLLQDWVPYILGKKVPRGANEKVKSYQSLYIHEFSVPQSVIEKSHELMREIFNEENRLGTASFGFWGWGSQVFISEQFLGELRLEKVKDYSLNELQDMTTNIYRHKGNIKNHSNPKDYFLWSKNTPETRLELKQKKKENEDRLSKITVQDEMKKRKNQYHN